MLKATLACNIKVDAKSQINTFIHEHLVYSAWIFLDNEDEKKHIQNQWE